MKGHLGSLYFFRANLFQPSSFPLSLSAQIHPESIHVSYLIWVRLILMGWCLTVTQIHPALDEEEEGGLTHYLRGFPCMTSATFLVFWPPPPCPHWATGNWLIQWNSRNLFHLLFHDHPTPFECGHHVSLLMSFINQLHYPRQLYPDMGKRRAFC